MFTSPESWSTCLSLFCCVLTVSVQSEIIFQSSLWSESPAQSRPHWKSQWIFSKYPVRWLIGLLTHSPTWKKTQRNLHISWKHLFVCQCFFFLMFKNVIYWSMVDLWYWVNFCCTAKWFSSLSLSLYIYIYFFIMAYHRILNIVPLLYSRPLLFINSIYISLHLLVYNLCTLLPSHTS